MLFSKKKNLGLAFTFAISLGFAQQQKPMLRFGASTELTSILAEVSKGKQAKVAYSVLGIEKNFNIKNNLANQHLPMLSVFKFHLALATLHLVDEGKLNLDQKIFIKKEELLPDTWSPLRDQRPEGNYEMPLGELIKWTVAQSDNNGCDIILRLIGGPQVVQDFMVSKGVKDIQIKYNEEEFSKLGQQSLYENYTTTQSLVYLLKDFYQGKIVSPTSTAFLLKIMEGTNTGMAKLPALLPGVTIARKTGSSGKLPNGLTVAENDSGIVTLPNGEHYAIAVFVNDSTESEETNTGMIAKISKLVYDYLNKK